MTNRMSHVPHLYDVVNLLKNRLKYSIFSYFSREAAVQESLMAPFFGQKCPNHAVFEGL